MRVLGQVGDLIDLQPLQEELAELRAGPQVGDHALGLAGHLLAGGQLAGRRGVEQLLVGQRIPQPEGEPRGHVVGVPAAADLAVEEPRRLEDEQHHALDGRFRVAGGLELAIDEEPLLLVGERPAERPLGEPPAELAEPCVRGRRHRPRRRPAPRGGRRRSPATSMAASVVAWSQALETDVPRS